MQELIEYMQELNTKPYVNGTTFREGAINYAKQLLKKEKEQLMNAFDENDSYCSSGSVYYDQTYNQNK